LNLKKKSFWSQKKIIKIYNKDRKNFNDLYYAEKIFLKNFLYENCSILDIGCAQGGFNSIIKKFIHKFKYTGVDESQEMINIAKLNFPESKFMFVKKNDLYKIKKKYDIVIILGILHLNKNWEKILKFAQKLSKKYIIFDLRASNYPTIENINRSYLKYDKKAAFKLPYNIINESNLIKKVDKIFPNKKIINIRYNGKSSKFSKTPIKKIIFSNFLVDLR